MAEIRVKLMYARQFTPHKIGYWEDRLQTAEHDLLQEWNRIAAENTAKALSKKNFCDSLF